MIEIGTSLVIFLSALNTSMTAAAAETVLAQEGTVNEVVYVNNEHPLTLEMYVRQYFKENPILAEVARCESTFKHYGKNGDLIRGIVDNDDVGVMQINTRFHGETAEKLGYDLETIDGNLAYAQNLYDRQGIQPWYASEKCWGAEAKKLGVNR